MPSFIAQNADVVTIPAGAAVRAAATGGGVVLAMADDAAHVAVGLAQNAGSPGQAITVQLAGPVTLADWTLATGSASLAPAGLYFLDPWTPGKYSMAVPVFTGQVVQVIGRALTADTLDLSPGESIAL